MSSGYREQDLSVDVRNVHRALMSLQEELVLRFILGEPERNTPDQREVDGVKQDSPSLRGVSAEGAQPTGNR